MKHIKKTNAARILDDFKLAYQIREYPVDEEHLDAIHEETAGCSVCY